ncbi:MAG: hypothetical protein M1825_004245 [Sarcosagium campestre]|nr:MAG: hypothetical protein M1825_004245 [Sarcosagium campestre]
MSAYIGSPPATENDFWIAKSLGFARGSTYLPVETPPGPPLDQGDIANRGPGFLGGLAVMMVLCVGFTVLRIITRWRRAGLKLGADDVAIAIAALLALVYYAHVMRSITNGGVGKHAKNVTYSEFALTLNLLPSQTIIFYASVGIAKISINLFNMRVTSMTTRYWMIFHRVLLFILVGFLLFCIFGNIFLCRPVRASFDAVWRAQNVDRVKCLNSSKFQGAVSYTHVGLDIILWSIPIVIIAQTKIRKAIKIRLLLLFCLGTIPVLCALLRINVFAVRNADPTWDPVRGITLMFSVELLFSIVITSLPALNPLLESETLGRFGSRVLSLGRSSGSRNTYGSSSGASNRPRRNFRRMLQMKRGPLQKSQSSTTIVDSTSDKQQELIDLETGIRRPDRATLHRQPGSDDSQNILTVSDPDALNPESRAFWDTQPKI